MADDDLTAVISYLRTLPAEQHTVPKGEWGFLAKALSGKFTRRSDERIEYIAPGEASLERGRYLANGPAACYLCHTSRDPMQGFAEVGTRFSGKTHPDPDLTDPKFEFVTPNLTPLEGVSIIAMFDENQFLSRFRAGRAFAGSHMPWENYQLMTNEDLKSLYRYLRSLPPAEGTTGPSRRPAGSE